MECLAQPQGKVFVVSLGGPLRTGARIVGRCTACRWALIHCRALQFIIPVLVSRHHCFPLFLCKLLAPNGNHPEPSFLAYLLFLFYAQLSSSYNYSVVKKGVFFEELTYLLDHTKRGQIKRFRDMFNNRKQFIQFSHYLYESKKV